MPSYEYAELHWNVSRGADPTFNVEGKDPKAIQATGVLDALNQLGADGWEAVSLTKYDPDPRFTQTRGEALLKRKVPAPEPEPVEPWVA